MKQIKIAAVFAIIAFVSCKKQEPKDWTCKCEVKPMGGSSKEVTTSIKQKTQNDASNECTDFGKASVGGSGSWKCSVSPG